MAGLFLSHSSQDKPIVYRLAFDLASRGFPVWFDVWDVQIGHSLTEAVRAGIDESDYVLIVISRNTERSRLWIPAEIGQALELERTSGRTIIIPIKLDATVPPEQLRDRVYADFSESYHTGLERLSTELRSLNIHRIAVPLSRRVIPLLIREGTLLQKSSFAQAVKSAKDSRQPGEKLLAGQLRLAPDDLYRIERDKMLRRMDAGRLSADREDRMNLVNAHLVHEEEVLLSGIALIVNEAGIADSFLDAGIAAYWFCKLVRTAMMTLVKEINSWVDARDPKFTPYRTPAIFFVENIYECAKRLDRVDVGPREPDERRMYTGFTLSVDPSLGLKEELDSWMSLYKAPIQQPLREMMGPADISKWVVPQLLYRVLAQEEKFPITWTYDDWMMGPH